MRKNKIEQLKSFVTEPGRAEFVHNLETGKFYKNGVEMSEKQWNEIQNKQVLVHLGEGTPPEPEICKN